MNQDISENIGKDVLLTTYMDKLKAELPSKTIADYRKEQYRSEKNTDIDYASAINSLALSQRSINERLKFIQLYSSPTTAYTTKDYLLDHALMFLHLFLKSESEKYTEIDYTLFIICLARLKDINETLNNTKKARNKWNDIIDRNMQNLKEALWLNSNLSTRFNIDQNLLDRYYKMNLYRIFPNALLDFLLLHQDFKLNSRTYDLIDKLYLDDINPYNVSMTFFNSASSSQYYLQFIIDLLELFRNSKDKDKHIQILELGESYCIDTENLSVSEQLYVLSRDLFALEKEYHSRYAQMTADELYNQLRENV